MPEPSTIERTNQPDPDPPATDAYTSSGAALFWGVLIVLSFAITLALIFWAAI